MSHDLRHKKFVDYKNLHNTGHGDAAFDHEKELTHLRSRSLNADIEMEYPKTEILVMWIQIRNLMRRERVTTVAK